MCSGVLKTACTRRTRPVFSQDSVSVCFVVTLKFRVNALQAISPAAPAGFAKPGQGREKRKSVCPSGGAYALSLSDICWQVFPYQMCARFSCGTKSLSPSLTLNALYQLSIIGRAAFTRLMLGE